MKHMLKYVIAGLLSSAAFVQAQISSFQVSSYSSAGNDVQIAGLFTSSNALLHVANSNPGWAPYYSNLSSYFGPYYVLPAGAAGTVVSNTSTSTPQYFTTTITNVYAPNIGYSSVAPIVNVSGRFRIESAVLVSVWVDDEWGGHYEDQYQGGSAASLTFTVAEGASFSLNILGQSLSTYGLPGLESPLAYVYGPSGYITSRTGEGSAGLGYLSPGQYTIVVYATDGTTSGIVLASINRQ